MQTPSATIKGEGRQHASREANETMMRCEPGIRRLRLPKPASPGGNVGGGDMLSVYQRRRGKSMGAATRAGFQYRKYSRQLQF
jgi:hypothetical protein